MSENIENNTQVKEEKVNETKQPDIKQMVMMKFQKLYLILK